MSRHTEDEIKNNVVYNEFDVEVNAYPGLTSEDADTMQSFEGKKGKKVVHKVR